MVTGRQQHSVKVCILKFEKTITLNIHKLSVGDENNPTKYSSPLILHQKHKDNFEIYCFLG